MQSKIKLTGAAVFFFVTMLLPARLGAQCLGQTKGKITIKINHCRDIEPKSHFSLKDSVPAGFYDLYETQTVISAFRTYRGSLVVGDVQKSQAYDPVLNDDSALLGQTITVFLNDVGENFCENLSQDKIWTGDLEQVCCDDSLNAPCLLDTSYTLGFLNKGADQQASVRDSASDVKHSSSAEMLSADVKKARSFFKKQDLKQTIVSFETAIEKKDQLQLIDHYILGLSYYLHSQSINKSVLHLEKIHEHTLTRTGQELEPFMKRSLLLLARVYAVSGNSDRSVMILNEMISESDHFREQIQSAMYHEDFGWINSTRRYQDFLRSALRIN